LLAQKPLLTEELQQLAVGLLLSTLSDKLTLKFTAHLMELESHLLSDEEFMDLKLPLPLQLSLPSKEMQEHAHLKLDSTMLDDQQLDTFLFSTFKD